MKNFLTFYANWRLDVIMLLIGIALILLCSDADNAWMLVLSKVAAIIVGYIAVVLGCLWSDKLSDIEIEE